MMKTTRLLPLVAMLAIAQASQAQEAPCQDPCVPKAKRNAPASPSPTGAALQEQAILKLKQRFDDADVDRNGSLTVAEARDIGFGFVVKHFDAIDQQGKGAVSFADVRRYLLDQKRK